MNSHWTSPRSGATYDTSRTDWLGNWVVVSAGPSLMSVAGGAALVIGSIGLVTAYIVAVVAILPVLIALYFARYPLLPPVLLIVALLLFVLPEGRRRWPETSSAAALSFVMLPATFFATWSLSNQGDTLYSWIASMPWMTLLALGITVWAAVKRLWPLVVLFGALFAISGLVTGISWLAVVTQPEELRMPPASQMGFDNVMAVMATLIIALLARVIGSQITVSMDRRRATAMQRIPGQL
ncbi:MULTISPECIES: hypothetical protein [unclassified Brachybacterium]|uniref:hypothetical protein n=1 Tax=unclassified Brachybacterium TaxID=2623841 RepID=UPI004033704F